MKAIDVNPITNNAKQIIIAVIHNAHIFAIIKTSKKLICKNIVLKN